GHALSRLDALSLVNTRSSEEPVSTLRSHSDLPADRRNLHAIQPGGVAWSMGLVDACGCLDPRDHRHHIKNQKANTPFADQHCALCDHGLARGHCRETDLDADPSAGNSLDTRGWTRVHRRARVLCRTANSLQPLYLAPLRDRGHHVSLLRRALVRIVAT